MEPIHAFVLGIVQGLTEFLPISSSGHLVIFQHMFGLNEPELYFDISVHIGTLIAVFVYFWCDIQAMLRSIFQGSRLLLSRSTSIKQVYGDPDIKLAVLIIIGTLPTVIIGLMFKTIADRLFSSLNIVGITLILTGVLLWGTRFVNRKTLNSNSLGIKQSIAIGIMQGIAIIPGVSRSGSTIAAGLYLGLDRKTAARFSFLLSIPAIIGASILILKDISTGVEVGIMPMIIGGATACVVGYCALRLLVYIVHKGHMHYFSPYCWLAGLTALIWSHYSYIF